MQLLGFLALAMFLFIVAFALDLGGAVAGMLFLLVLFTGALLRSWQPLIDWARGPASKL